MSTYIITEYSENIKKANLEDMSSDGSYILDAEVSYAEPNLENNSMLRGNTQYVSSSDPESYNKGEGEDDQAMDEQAMDAEVMDLPGLSDGANPVMDSPAEDEKSMESKSWAKDNAVADFSSYIKDAYPGKIPRHDGTSTLGCERAIKFLEKLNGEISKALRLDEDDVLDIEDLERIRVNIVKDVVKLKKHIKKLKAKLLKESGVVIADENILKTAEISKVASTPTIQLVVTPFERAIAGILINSTVSAGRPFEDVYARLKEKYSLDDREELSIMQLLKDMGHPIFKDRGAFGKRQKKDEKAEGMDFITNYFA
jgi:hypothetical protein